MITALTPTRTRVGTRRRGGQKRGGCGFWAALAILLLPRALELGWTVITKAAHSARDSFSAWSVSLLYERGMYSTVTIWNSNSTTKMR